MKVTVVRVIVGVVKVLFHALGLCKCCKKEEKNEKA